MRDYLPEHIPDRGISGFHIYRLDAPACITYASESLCQMTGFTAGELEQGSPDPYAAHVHPADLEKYNAFLRKAAGAEGTHTCDYRLIKKDGTALWVRDTMTGEQREGVMQGYSCLSEISSLKEDMDNLSFMTDTLSCGFLTYTCERQPRVTYVNQNMLDLLRFPESRPGEIDYLELYKSNVALMIPMEERGRFSRYLEKVYETDGPLPGELTLLRFDGTRVHVYGWVARTLNEKGEDQFQAVCLDVTERHKAKELAANARYLNALTDVYDKIFEFNLEANAVKCLYCTKGSMFYRFMDLNMQIDEACEKWISSAAAMEDRDKLRAFFANYCRSSDREPAPDPPQIAYRAMGSDGRIHLYNGLFVKVDEGISYFCCREVPSVEDAKELRSENDQLRESLNALIRRLSDDSTGAGRPAVSIRTFGYFDVFVGDQAINFRSKKAKELLALLVDRRGGYVTTAEAISYLWENEPVTRVTQARCRKTALRLKNTLEEYNIADIIESVDGKRRIIPEKVSCDLYDYLSGKEEYAQLFRGSYLSNYSWAETTLGELTGTR